MKPVCRFLVKVIALTIVAPIALGSAWFYFAGWPLSWRTADWSATGIAQPALGNPEPVIQIYAARTGRWKSIFAVHTWIVIKPRGAAAFDRYEVVGWGRPVRHNAYPPDGRWYGNRPEIIHEVRGAAASRLIGRIEQAIARYPYGQPGDYTIWPGPNSNTFVAWVARQVPELGLEMPPTAIGKDFLGSGIRAAATPSGTGWQVSWGGVAGIGAGLREGVEVNVLGATIGIDPEDLAIKLPSLGSIGPSTIVSAFAGEARD